MTGTEPRFDCSGYDPGAYRESGGAAAEATDYAPQDVPDPT